MYVGRCSIEEGTNRFYEHQAATAAATGQNRTIPLFPLQETKDNSAKRRKYVTGVATRENSEAEEKSEKRKSLVKIQ